MDLGLDGKVALVFGAGGGLGSAIATTMAREGMRLALGDINASAVEGTAAAITAAGGTAIALPWDLADRSVIEARVAAIAG